MLILSTTFLVEERVADSWQLWVKSIFLSLLHESPVGAEKILFCKVHSDAQQDGQTFSLQIQFDHLDALDRYSHEVYSSCEQVMNRKFGGTYLVFQTVLEEL